MEDANQETKGAKKVINAIRRCEQHPEMQRMLDITASLVQFTKSTAVSVAEYLTYIDEESEVVDAEFSEHMQELADLDARS